MMDLRQSTASQEITLGYFLDSTDGDTEETGLTIANTDIKIRKGGGTTLISKNLGGATHISNGVYSAVLDATDTNTVGQLEVYCHVTGALATKTTFNVLTATAYDAIYTGTFNNLGGTAQTADHTAGIADIPTVAEFNARTLVAASYFDPATDTVANVTLVATTTTNTDMRGTDSAATAANLATVDANVDAILVDTGTTIPATITTMQNDLDVITDSDGVVLGAAGVDLIWDEVLTGATHNVNNSSGKRLRGISGSILTDGTAQSGGNNSIQLASGDITLDEQYARAKVIITSGTGTGQEAIITSSVASTDTLTITPTWLVNPDVTSDYQIVPAQTHQTVRNGGYDNGKIYIDTNGTGSAGTEKGVNGTTSNKSNNMADATTIAVQENSKIFEFTKGSSETLAQTYGGYQFNGNGSSLALGGQDVGSSFFTLFFLSGINSSATQAIFNDCLLSSVTTTTAAIINCSLTGTLTLSSAASYAITHCQDSSGSTPAIIDFGAAVGNTHVEILDYNGRLELQNLGQTGTDTVIMSGDCQELVINANCTGGTITLSGAIKVTDNSGGAVTINSDALAVTGEAGAGLSDLGGMSTAMKAEVNAEADTALTDYDGPTNTEMNVRTPTAAQLAYITAHAATALPVTFSGGTTTTAIFTNVDGSVASSTDDVYNGRVLIFNAGTLDQQVTDITDYVGSTTTATITALTTAVTGSHTAILV